MPSFSGGSIVWVQPSTSEYPLRVTFSAEYAAGANDGSLPYGTTITSATIVASDADGTTSDDLVDDGSIVTGDTYVDCTLSYPTLGDGLYTLEYRLTLSSGAVIPYDAKRVYCGDRAA